MYKNEITYINSLRHVDFDPCTLSVNGYRDEFNDMLNNHPSLIETFFNTHKDYAGSIENFINLIWVSESLEKVTPHMNNLIEMCTSDDPVIIDSALKLISRMIHENIDVDYTFLPDLDIKIKWLKQYSLKVYNEYIGED